MCGEILIGKAELDRLNLPSLEQSLEAAVSRVNGHQEGTGDRVLTMKNSANVAANVGTKSKSTSKDNFLKQGSPNSDSEGARKILNNIGGSIISCSELMSSGDDDGARKLMDYAGDAKKSSKELMSNTDDAGARKILNNIGGSMIHSKELMSNTDDAGARKILNNIGGSMISSKELMSNTDDAGAGTLLSSTGSSLSSCSISMSSGKDAETEIRSASVKIKDSTGIPLMLVM